jgi:hypothetical protein
MLTAQIFPQCLARKQGTLYLASRRPTQSAHRHDRNCSQRRVNSAQRFKVMHIAEYERLGAASATHVLGAHNNRICTYSGNPLVWQGYPARDGARRNRGPCGRSALAGTRFIRIHMMDSF